MKPGTVAYSCLVCRWIISVVACLLAFSAEALTPGPVFVLECPGCHAAVKYYSIGSGNTFGAKFWTDGKMDAPMLPDKSPIVKCPKCARLFWLAKAKELRRIETYASEQEANYWEKTPTPNDPSEQDLLKVAESKELSRDEQLTVRLRAWWMANDSRRYGPGTGTKPFSEAQVQNLKKLSSLLDEKKTGERVMKAEIARELGQFKDCVRWLKGSFEKDYQKDRAEFIRGLAAEKDPVVRQFP